MCFVSYFCFLSITTSTSFVAVSTTVSVSGGRRRDGPCVLNIFALYFFLAAGAKLVFIGK